MRKQGRKGGSEGESGGGEMPSLAGPAESRPSLVCYRASMFRRCSTFRIGHACMSPVDDPRWSLNPRERSGSRPNLSDGGAALIVPIVIMMTIIHILLLPKCAFPQSFIAFAHGGQHHTSLGVLRTPKFAAGPRGHRLDRRNRLYSIWSWLPLPMYSALNIYSCYLVSIDYMLYRHIQHIDKQVLFLPMRSALFWAVPGRQRGPPLTHRCRLGKVPIWESSVQTLYGFLESAIFFIGGVERRRFGGRRRPSPATDSRGGPALNLLRSTRIDSDRLGSTRIDSNPLVSTLIDSYRLGSTRIDFSAPTSQRYGV